MGYSVPEHFAALDRLGPTIHHRRSFAPVAARLMTCGNHGGRAGRGRCRCQPQAPDPPASSPRPGSCILTAEVGRIWRGRSHSRQRWRKSCARQYCGNRRFRVAVPVKGVLGAPGMVSISLVRRAAAHPAAPAVLDHGGAPGRPVDARAVAVFSGAARKAAAGAGDRSRIPARHRIRAAARLLAGRDSPTASAGMFGVYLLSQVCIVVTYWAVLAFGRVIVGEIHAVMAVLLMAGVAVFSVPTPEFGPAHSRNAAVGADAVALLARRATRRIWLLAGAWHRSGLAAAHDLCRNDSDRPCGAVQLSSQVGRAHMGPSVHGSRVSSPSDAVSLSGLARSRRRHQADRPCQVVQNLRMWRWTLTALLLGHVGLAILVVLGRGSFFPSRSAAGGDTAGVDPGGARASSISLRLFRSSRWGCSLC